MRIFSPATAAHFASREAFCGHVLIWITARNRISGAAETIGLWSGADHRDFAIDGATRTYYGAGEFIAMDPIRRRTGIRTATQRVSFSHVTPAGMTLVATHDPRHAPIEVHRALFDPSSDVLIDEPHLILAGFIDKAVTTRPAKNEGGGAVTIEIATHARALTRTLSRYRSNATMRMRAADDAFRQYASLADSIDTPWGREGASGSSSGPGAPWGPKSFRDTTPATTGGQEEGGGSWLRR